MPFLRIKFIDKYLVDEYETVTGYTIQTAYYNNDREYAYKIMDLADLQGSANYYKRKRIKKILENKDISVETITNSNIKLLPEIEEKWCSQQDCPQCRAFYGCEKDAIEVFLKIFDEKVHHGLYIYDNKNPAGYIISEKINEKINFLYFGKSIIPDGFLFLIYKMYSEHATDSEYMNINEDMGHEGLRKFKKMLSTYELWKKYMITYNKNMFIEGKI
ncbi:MAG: phosphatidylglycerol lysyltransferase domain-containing protein [Treponema sp.]|nr:phosphatidylglycerol lysyltransferase domain-containing protein [Treponema sp.]